MFLCSVLRLAALLAAVSAVDSHRTSGHLKNFLVRNVLDDGERETRINLNGVTAKEVAVGGGDGLKLRQLTDGRHFIQLIYDPEDRLQDCEYVQDPASVHKFLAGFKREAQSLTSKNSTSTELLRGLRKRTLPADVRWLDYRRLRRECARRHRDLKRLLAAGSEGVEGKGGSEGGGNQEQQEGGLRRRRREISDYLRVPGTKWCGKGKSAAKYTDVGMFSTTDRCCRRHDSACPFWISAFQTKYGLFNWRVNTIMHCHCDESFRACLKMVGTSDANFVGKLFFNIVQTKCFVFKPKKVCTQRSWWGKCLKTKHRKQAVLRNNMSY